MIFKLARAKVPGQERTSKDGKARLAPGTPLMHGSARFELLSARASVKVAGRIITKSALCRLSELVPKNPTPRLASWYGIAFR
jgi:hypothetical protein